MIGLMKPKQDPAKAAIARLDQLSKRMQYALSDPKEFKRLCKALRKNGFYTYIGYDLYTAVALAYEDMSK